MVYNSRGDSEFYELTSGMFAAEEKRIQDLKDQELKIKMIKIGVASSVLLITVGLLWKRFKQ